MIDQLYMVALLSESDCDLTNIMLVLVNDAASTDPDDVQLNKRQMHLF